MSHGSSRLGGNTRIRVNVWTKPDSRPSSNTGKRPKSVTTKSKPTKGSTGKQQCQLSVSGEGARKNTTDTTESFEKVALRNSRDEKASGCTESGVQASTKTLQRPERSNVKVTDKLKDNKNQIDTNCIGKSIEVLENKDTIDNHDTEMVANSVNGISDEIGKCSVTNFVKNFNDCTKISGPSKEKNDMNGVMENTKCVDDGTKTSSRSDKTGSNGHQSNNKDTSMFTCEIDSDVTSPWLRGLACMANGDIVCLDLNNECLKRFNINLDHISSIEVSPDNNGLTKVSDSEVAVTCLNEVHFYHVGKFGMNRLSKHFRLQGMGYGISHNNNWFAVTADITEEEDATIRVLDQDGNEQYVIETREINGAHVMLSWYIQLDELKEQVYVSDAETPQIVCFSFFGDIVWTLPLKGGGPRDLLLVDDNLILSNQTEQKVVKVPLERRQQIDLYTFNDGVINPDYIAYCSESKRLYVTYRGFGMIGAFVLE